jgi:hypothetical protein
MNISEMSDQEKSVMLARVCGWFVEDMGDYQNVFERGGRMSPKIMSINPLHNLYTPDNMQASWRVLNWAATQYDNEFGEQLINWFYSLNSEMGDEIDWIVMRPAEAQRTWLDKILELAIEAGLVAPQEQAGKEEATG